MPPNTAPRMKVRMDTHIMVEAARQHKHWTSRVEDGRAVVDGSTMSTVRLLVVRELVVRIVAKEATDSKSSPSRMFATPSAAPAQRLRHAAFAH